MHLAWYPAVLFIKYVFFYVFVFIDSVNFKLFSSSEMLSNVSYN